MEIKQFEDKRLAPGAIGVMNILLKYKLTIFGVIAGAVAGYLYYYYVGCASGTCAITSKPLNSALYGALMGGLWFSTFKKKKDYNKKITE